MKKKSQQIRFPLARVKKIIQKNEEVGKIAHSIPFLISKCLEHFLNDLLDNVLEENTDCKTKLVPAHLKDVISKNKNYDFLQYLFKEVENLDEIKDKKNKNKKKTKKNKFSDEIPKYRKLNYFLFLL